MKPETIKILPETIIKIVTRYFHAPLEKVLTTSRERELVTVRQVSMYFIKKYNDKMSLAEIGSNFPGRGGFLDHATVIHALRTVEGLIETDKQYRCDINELQELFKEIAPERLTMEEIMQVEESALIFENRHLRREIEELKKEVGRLQGKIFALKLSKNNKTVDVLKPIEPKSIEIKPQKNEVHQYVSPFNKIESCNDREFHGFRPHQL